MYFLQVLLFMLVFWNSISLNSGCPVYWKSNMMKFYIPITVNGFCIESIKVDQFWPLLLTLSGEPWSQHMPGGVWFEPVHRRTWPEGGVFTLWSSGRGQCGVRPAYRALSWLCLHLLWENWGFQRGMGSFYLLRKPIIVCSGLRDSFIFCLLL